MKLFQCHQSQMKKSKKITPQIITNKNTNEIVSVSSITNEKIKKFSHHKSSQTKTQMKLFQCHQSQMKKSKNVHTTNHHKQKHK
jgi:hypothetical protein